MRLIAWALLLGASLAATSGREPAGRVVEVSTAEELKDVLREPLQDTVIKLKPGRYPFVTTQAIGNDVDCSEGKRSQIPISVGLKISGRNVKLVGPDDAGAVVVTSAAYGIFFDKCAGCELDHLTVTNSAHTTERAAAIIAEASTVRISNCVIRDCRVTGIEGMEGANLTVQFNEIVGNTQGIALINDAHASITNNLITGITTSPADRGLGLSIQCNASATLERNHLSGFQHGILVLGRTSLECSSNVIEDMAGDGVCARDSSLGRLRVENNAFFRCGSAGITIVAFGDQTATRNLVVETGQHDPRRSGIHVYGAHAEAAARKNTLYDNAVTDPKLDRDVSREVFWRARRPWTRTYRNTPVGVDGRHKFYESAFLTRYGRWAD